MARQFFKACNTRFGFRLASFRVLANPFQFFFQGFLACAFAAFFLLKAVLLLVQPGTVVAFPRNARSSVQFQNPFGGIVQKVAVVGNSHHSTWELVQELLKPVHRFSIQVVGGFVQQQHVRFAHQQAAQCHTAFLTTGKRGHAGFPRGQAQ